MRNLASAQVSGPLADKSDENLQLPHIEVLSRSAVFSLELSYKCRRLRHLREKNRSACWRGGRRLWAPASLPAAVFFLLQRKKRLGDHRRALKVPGQCQESWSAWAPELRLLRDLIHALISYVPSTKA
jgi:hypothetical protein